MLRFSIGLISMILFCSIILLGFISTSYADIEIVELRSYNGTNIEYDRGSTYFTFYVRTNEPYGALLWSVDGGANDGILGNGKKKDHYFSFSNLAGRLKGNTYRIEVTAYGLDPNGHLVLPTDNMVTATYAFTVYKPIVISGIKQPIWEKPTVTGVYGYNELSRHYFDGTDIIMDGYVYASNKTDNICQMTAWFRHSNFATGWSDEHSAPTEDIGPDPKNKGIKRTYGPYYTDSSILNFHVGGPIGDRDRHTLNVHIHLNADGNGTTDTWHGIDERFDNEFTSDDNP